MKPILALAALAATAVTAAAQPLAAAEPADSITSANKLKRTTFAIDSIIARAAPVCTSSDSNTLCAQQSQALASIAGTALEGYAVALDKRAPPGQRGFIKQKDVKKNKKKILDSIIGFVGAPAGDTGSKVKRDVDGDVDDEVDDDDDDVELEKRAPPGQRGFIKPKAVKKNKKKILDSIIGFVGAPAGDTGSKVKRAPPGQRGFIKQKDVKKNKKKILDSIIGFVGAPAGDTGSKVKRDALPESLIAHCDNDADFCQVDERDPEDAYLLSKRDAEEYDVEETMQPRGVGETLIAIRDAVDVIKREAAVAGEGDDELVDGYFEVIDEKVKRAVELLED